MVDSRALLLSVGAAAALAAPGARTPEWPSVDRQVGDPSRLKTDVWYQSSADQGVTWSAALRVTTAQTDETVAGADSGNQYGDYNGLSGFLGKFLPSWTDRRDQTREEIWTAPITDP
jgi:hypothetical protein